MITFCSQCNAAMSCDPGHDCWCADLPHALPVPDRGTTGCLCRDCLTTKLNLDGVEGTDSLTPNPKCSSPLPRK
jgi:hypothetical protein